jgi:hypothetical protein
MALPQLRKQVPNPFQQFQSPSGVDSVSGAVYATGVRPLKIAEADARSGMLTIRRKTHGTWIEREIHITELVAILDPSGTTVKGVE